VLRSRKLHQAYLKHRKTHPSKECVFCNPDPVQVVEDSSRVYVIRNIFPYDLWDFKQVHDHLMIVPKHHVDAIGNLTKAEQADFMEMLSKYEAKGYNYYGRASNNPIKSITHQHTHLIKTDGPNRKFAVYLKKPYVLWHR
jgi:diadenosine tetraphosphate (Ap4A) HIT family hydrolase